MGDGGVKGHLRRRKPTCTTNHNPCLHLSMSYKKYLTLLVQS